MTTKRQCKNKSCKKGNFEKRLRFEPERPSQLCCSTECAIEVIQSTNYKRKYEQEIRIKNAKEKEIFYATDQLRAKKNPLQDTVNLLARMIDEKCGITTCICCNLPLTEGGIDGAHFHSVGSSESIRYNLHNIHSATKHCNHYKAEHYKHYVNGLKNKYGTEYFEYVDGLKVQYSYIGLKVNEYLEKKKIASKLVRKFDTLNITDPLKGRDLINELIGIYPLPTI